MISSIDKPHPLRIGIDGMVTPTLRTGVGRYLENIILFLDGTTENIECTVYLGSNQKDLSNLLPKHFLAKQSRISTEQSLLNFLRLQFVLPYMCKKHKTDVLHIPNEKLLLFKPCPVVITIHDVADFRVSKRTDFVRRIYRRVAMPFILRFADHIIAVSERTKCDLIELFQIDADKITVIPEGISKNFCEKPTTQEIWNTRRKFNIVNEFILFVGEISKRKNLGQLINAFRTTEPRKLRKMQLVLVGKDGSATDDIRSLVDHYDLHDRVVLTGYISDKDVAALYYSAHCLVLPSLYEGFGLPAIEAMACGLPVISSNTGSLPEVVGDAGLVLDCNIPERLSKALVRLANDELLHSELRSKGLERSKRFNWDNCALETLKVYQKAIKEYCKQRG